MKKILSFIILLVWAISILAVPANRRPFVVVQSDGAMLSIVLQGDEVLHFHTTLDGKYIVKGDDGSYYYATFSKNGGFLSVGVLAHNEEDRTAAEKELLAGIDYTMLDDAVAETHLVRSAKYRATIPTRSATTRNALTKDTVLVPVLLVEFQDKKFTTDREYIDAILNESNYKEKLTIGNATIDIYGSARDYFIAQSDSLFFPKFVVSEILTLPQDMAYYGGDNSSGDDNNPQAMIRDGIELADAAMDFKKFDNDANGEVEFLYCIYAGYSEANAADVNTIWPHQWDLSSKGGKKEVDGVKCNVYACSSELNFNESTATRGYWPSGIGTICHEFSHCLGLRDVYDVKENNNNWGMDEWDLMGNGNHNAYGYIPVGYNSYQKDACGWKKLKVLDKGGSYSMEPQTRGGYGYKIVNNANPNEYFILENRMREGWDQTLRADGMMIIHVDYDKTAWESNKINVTPGHPRFQIVPADNELIYYTNANKDKFNESMLGDLWPGKNNNNEFSNTSFPAAKVFTGGYLNKPVTNIKYENYIASFDFNIGALETPVEMPATNVENNSFVANWNMVDYSTGYLVELYRMEHVEDGGDDETLLEEDFLNCNLSNTAIHDNMDVYMSVKGWSGNCIYSETGMLCIGSLNNPGTLTTPLLNAEGNVRLSFDISKYNSNADDINLIVEALNDSNEVIASKNISSAGACEWSVDIKGEFYIRFSTTADATNKRVLIDDISVMTTLPYKKELVEEVTTEENSYKFENLEQGEYLYRVKATVGDVESDFSGYVKVVLGTASVLDVVEHGSDVVIYTITGVKICEGNVGVLQNMPRGIYIVKSSAGIKKIKIE